MIRKGREIADKLGEKLTAVLVGYNVENKAEELIHYGADHVIVVEMKIRHIYDKTIYKGAFKFSK
ncbi:hypothetical protein [Alkalithermobacter thermoalcaliphilus]|uniref:hypothetical protein n=1 Tax=Clostridium paradoxum TaxID=29346 RepID=UPI002FE5A113